MATSNSTNFNQTRNEIISDALQLLGVIGANDTAAANDITFCSNLLNKMVKSWEAQGVHLWTASEAIIALRDGVNKYTLVNSASGDKAGDSAIDTTLTADASSGATTLTLDDTTGMTAADNIGIALDDNTRHWTTIVSVDSSTQVTITSGLASAASSGNTVITYTTKLDRPLNIVAVRYKNSSGVERELRKMGRVEFMRMPNKSNTGTVNSYYYSPQRDNGLLYVYLTPSDANDYLTVSYLRSIQDFDASSDNPDFPQEWLDPITHNLAVRAAPAYGISLSKTNPDLVVTAKTLLEEMNAWDTEEGSLRIVPNHRYDN